MMVATVQREEATKPPVGLEITLGGVTIRRGEYVASAANSEASLFRANGKLVKVLLLDGLIAKEEQAAFVRNLNLIWGGVIEFALEACMTHDGDDGPGGASARPAPVPRPVIDEFLVGSRAIAKWLYGSEEYERKVFNLRNTRFPFVNMGGMIALRPATFWVWVEDQEARNAANDNLRKR